MTAGVYTVTSTVLPPAFVGEAYEAAIAAKATAPSEVTAQSISGAPSGLSIDVNTSAKGSLRITGTPDDTPGTFTVALSFTDGTGTNTASLSLRLYASRRDPAFLADESVAGQVSDLDLHY